MIDDERHRRLRKRVAWAVRLWGMLWPISYFGPLLVMFEFGVQFVRVYLWLGALGLVMGPIFGASVITASTFIDPDLTETGERIAWSVQYFLASAMIIMMTFLFGVFYVSVFL